MEIENSESMILSNNYADLIVPVQSTAVSFLETYQEYSPQLFGGQLGMIHVSREKFMSDMFTNYSQIPRLYTTLDTISLESSGILRVQNQPSLGYKGEGILIGFIDTGIDYTLNIFRKSNGQTRILGIWDQTISSDITPYDLGYGTSYSEDQINQALDSDQPFSAVPTMDENGHGTFIAGIACGSPDKANDFIGAAPESDIAVVKLKPAKPYLLDYYLTAKTSFAYQETDIMMGIRYLITLSVLYEKPLVLCISVGTNQGDHNGNSPLDRLLTFYIDYQNCFCACAGGNESGKAHHYYHPASDIIQETTELIVDKSETGFSLEFWADSPGFFQISITSPLGETIPPVTPRQGLSTTYRFAAERSVLDIKYEIAEYESGSQLILIRFFNPTPGLWRLNVSTSSPPLGAYHMWLPISGFLSSETVFLNPDPDTTITNPGNTESVLTCSGYSAYTGSLYLNSSRGYTRNGRIKPDLCAPAVNVYGPESSSLSNGVFLAPLTPYSRKTGTSFASAITAGAIALLINWNMDSPYPYTPFMTNRSVKNYFIRGAKRQDYLPYPNKEWGYGQLNLFGVFQSLM